MPKSVQLSNGRKWQSQKDALKHFRDMLARYQDGERVADESDDGDLRALVLRYDSLLTPGGETKAGAGIEFFSRQLNSGDGWATPGFHVHRKDGTSIDFSFYRAVQSKLMSNINSSNQINEH
jgi:hypothetical protein